MKLHVRVAFYCDLVWHTRKIIIILNQPLDMPYLSGGQIIANEKCSLTVINLFSEFEINMPFVCVEKVLDL